jgi:hypothetical protein
MPADPIHPHQLDGAARFRTDLTAYLDSLSVGELAELLGELPRSRQEPLGLGVLMIALNERLPDAYRLLPPAGHPGPGEGRRRSLRQVVADRRAARTSRHAGLSPSELAEWLADRQRQAEQQADRRRAGAVAERRVAEALRTPPTDPNPAAGRQEHGDRPAEPADRERDREPEDWTVPEPPPRAEPWLPLGGDDQEHDQPPDRSRRWHGEERDDDREDR